MSLDTSAELNGGYLDCMKPSSFFILTNVLSLKQILIIPRHHDGINLLLYV